MKSLPVHMTTVLFAIAMSFGFTGLTNIITEREQKESEKDMTGLREEFNGEISSTTSSGNIYTLDGRNMLEHFFITQDSDTQKYTDISEPELFKRNGDYRCDCVSSVYMPSEICYAPIVGHKYQSGLLSGADFILFSSDSRTNKMLAKGNNIVTTIVSDAQIQAYEEIKEIMDNKDIQADGENNFSACIAVVSKDGAILADAGSNADASYLHAKNLWYYEHSSKQNEEGDYVAPEEPPWDSNAFIDMGTDFPQMVGSSFKPITARVLEQYSDEVDYEFSVYNNEYTDVNTFVSKYMTVNCWDYNKHENWTETPEGKYVRYNTSLASAFINSSNTYFARHCEALGWDKYVQGLKDIFELDTAKDIYISRLSPIFFSEEDEERFPNYYYVPNTAALSFGNDAKLSPVHLASLYNTAMTGERYYTFMIAEIIDNEGNILHKENPEKHMEKIMDIDISDDIVIKSLKETASSYYNSSFCNNTSILSDYASAFNSGRLLTKSGTVAIIEGNEERTGIENRTMAVTLLNESGTDVICTAVIAVNRARADAINNDFLIEKLLKVLRALEAV